MNILFIEDHVLVRESIVYVLKKLYEDIFVIETSSIPEALQLIPNMKSLDMVLLDIALPGVDGLTALPDLRKELGALTPIVVLTGSDDSDILRKAKERGATDCIHKNCNRNELVNRLRFIIDTSSEQAPPDTDNLSHESLTLREKEVLQLIARGDQDKVIAFKLGITIGTTKNHIGKILLKLNATNRMCAVLKAIELRIIPPLD
ncbi:MAG TPA: DNA-binding response regulator [Nitrosomonas nitrosa]|uniref:Two component transcriptional regulator, LuxR family n=1 Tax=Nitrosomonas nitrosa TaxID=52442 RepID=A0A1I4LMS5_9PROT|nr:response regulator transcription factor [Nitrosomonas nitrosa]MCO6435370.1 response regulator transcription factor [Nitrosomonas nitrosa]SFL92146.1 two component transcriptional regulator, LuxR family [Nitrosomonas nitrosa]HBZ30611.1 DNA-binding response regulator [Nitrosomonas nitrosa]HNP51124.1 response regulator transcription factor [Nitrosomonas nitrosa]